MMTESNGERRFLWKALSVLCALLLSITLLLSGWTLKQVIGLKITTATVVSQQLSQARRLGRIERHIDVSYKVKSE